MKKTILLKEDELKSLLKKMVVEALKPSQFRKYVQKFDRERYVDIFKMLGDKYSHDKNYYRIYIPLQEGKKQGPISETEKQVKSFLEQNGYKDIDYVKGTCRYGDSKNLTTIGKALSRMKNNDLMNKFVSDESRKAVTSTVSDLMVVISRHPYDIAGSDTDRNWTNCMTMGHSTSPRIKELENKLRDAEIKYETYKAEAESGPKEIAPAFFFPEREVIPYEKQEKIRQLYRKIIEIGNEIKDRKEEGSNVMYILNEVKEGALISYLIKKDDKNIENPLAVLNIKPYVNKSNNSDFVLASDLKMYGQGRPEFKGTIDSVLNLVNGNKTGIYCLKSGMYSDNPSKNIVLMDETQKEFVNLAYKKIIEKLNSGYILKSLDRIYSEIASEQFNESLNDIESNLDFNLDDDDFDSLPDYSNELDLLLMSEKNKIISKFKDWRVQISKEDVLEFYSDNASAYLGKNDMDSFVEDFLDLSDLVLGDLRVELDIEIRALCNEYVDKVLRDNENRTN